MATTLRYRRLLKLGSYGPDVTAVKRALKKAGFGKGLKIVPHFGGAMDTDLRAFQKKHGLVVDGQYGPRTHAKLVPFFDAWGRKLYWMPLPKPPVSQTAKRIVDYCRWAVQHEGSIHYAQVRPIPPDPYALPKYTDCSGFAKSAYHAADAPSPDKLPWTEGNTTSLQQHGVRVVSPEPGDLVFYRDPDHVGVYIGDGKVAEHGGESGPKIVDEWYRTVTDIRRYLGAPI